MAEMGHPKVVAALVLQIQHSVGNRPLSSPNDGLIARALGARRGETGIRSRIKEAHGALPSLGVVGHMGPHSKG